MKADRKKTTQVHQQLFQWWQKSGRVLPWRQKLKTAEKEAAETSHMVREKAFSSYFAGHVGRDPYRVVVSELMLQQTQVDRVLPKYEAWMSRWPTIIDLSQATLAEVLIFWQGLGYNRRARFLWLLAKEIGEKRVGVWPQTEEELLTLPGIGKYTARAVLSFAFGQQVGVVDTNVKRILQRVFIGLPTLRPPSEKEFFAFADQVLPAEQADPWNQALMDFGALICTARTPKCTVCPLQKECCANQEAIAQGWGNFAEYLKNVFTVQKSSQPTSAQKIRFEDTDRYFRGRIMDELRSGEHNQDHLKKIMVNQYGLTDETRFIKLLTNLKNEELIHIRNGMVQIGEAE